MKKIFTTLIAGSLMTTAGIEVKANLYNSDLQNDAMCDPSTHQINLEELSDGGGFCRY